MSAGTMQRGLLACELRGCGLRSRCLLSLSQSVTAAAALVASCLTPSCLSPVVPADRAYGQSTGGYNAYGSRRLSGFAGRQLAAYGAYSQSE